MNRYRIFISSTIDDLRTARASVDEELTATEIFDTVRVENLPAVGETSRRVCLDEVAGADALVLILKDRYGFIPDASNPEGLSVTHLEYREAKRLKKSVFAFIREGVEPEPRLLNLIQEVSDFDEGVLRKKWESIDQLRSEVRRALLFWLARRAREQPSQEDREQAAEQLARYPELGELHLVVDAGPTPGDALRGWLDSLLEHLSLECKQRLLPSPRPTDEPARTSHEPTLMLRIQPASQTGRLVVTIALSGDEGCGDRKNTLPPPIEVDAAQTTEGARFAAQSSLALVLIAADDWSGSIDQLFAAAGNRNASHGARARLVGTAAYISAFNQGQRSSDVVRRMLDLPSLDVPTVSAGIASLVAAQLRFEHARARHALAEAEQLTLQLLTLALSRNPASSETLYNLARQSLKHSPAAALGFYAELVRTDPSYDERWYTHRDLGLIHYDSGQHREAARHYDLACHLKGNDSELFRFAGDAYYYRGYWAEALIRYERAVEIDPIETYFLDGKIDFARGRIRKGIVRDRRFRRKQALSHWFSRVAVGATKSGREWTARPLFAMAKRLCDVNFDADIWLALYANRRGSYEEAIGHLRAALAAIPEDASTRLNLVVNLIFQNNGQLVEESRAHAKIAIFHGGPETRSRFRLRLTNTENRDELCEQFEEIFDIVKREREEWMERRGEVLKPEAFGGVIHFEFRQ